MKIKKYNPKTTDWLNEQHDIVDENDRVIGTAPRINFLENKNLIRRSCHIWLKSSDGKFWFQQRGKDKDLQPVYWSCSAAGFVSAGARTKKEILTNAARELFEELGVKTDLKLVKIYLHRSKAVGGIMVYLYTGFYDGHFQINKKELSDIKAFYAKEFNSLYKKGKIKITEPTKEELKFILNNEL